MYYIDNYRRRAVEKIIPYLIDFPEIIKIIETNADRYQDIEDLIWKVAESLHLDDARGVWLEAHAYNEGTNFAYTDKATDAFTYGTNNPLFQAYGTGHYYNQTSFASGKKKTQSEDKTIRAVKAKIIQNNTDCNIEDFIEGVKLLYNVSNLKIYESYPFNISVMLCGKNIELSSTGNYENIKGFLPACVNLKNIYVDPYTFDMYLYNPLTSAYDITRYPVRVGSSTDIYNYISNSITLRDIEYDKLNNPTVVNEYIKTKQNKFADKDFCGVVFKPSELKDNAYILNVSGIDSDNTTSLYTKLDIECSNKDLIIINTFETVYKLIKGYNEFIKLDTSIQQAIIQFSKSPDQVKDNLIQFAGADAETQQFMIQQGLIDIETAQFAIAVGVENLIVYRDVDFDQILNIDPSIIALFNQLIGATGIQEFLLTYGLYTSLNSQFINEVGTLSNQLGTYSGFSDNNYLQVKFDANSDAQFDITSGSDISGIQNILTCGDTVVDMRYSEEKGSYNVSCNNPNIEVTSDYQGIALDEINPVKLVQESYRTYSVDEDVVDLPQVYTFDEHSGSISLQNEDFITFDVEDNAKFNIKSNSTTESTLVNISDTQSSLNITKSTNIQRNVYSNVNVEIDDTYTGSSFGLESHKFECKYDNHFTNNGEQFNAKRNSTDVKIVYYIIDNNLYRVNDRFTENTLNLQPIDLTGGWSCVSCLFKSGEPDDFDNIYYLGIKNGNLYSINYGTNAVQLIDDTRSYTDVSAYLYHTDDVASIQDYDKMHFGMAIANNSFIRICTNGTEYAIKEYKDLGTCTCISGGSAYRISNNDFCHSYFVCDGKLYAFDKEPIQVGSEEGWTYVNGETIHDCGLSGAFGICNDTPYKLNGLVPMKTSTSVRNWGEIASGTYASVGMADNVAMYLRWTSGGGDTSDLPTTTPCTFIGGWDEYGYGNAQVDTLTICDYGVGFLVEGKLYFVYLGLGTVFYWANNAETNKNTYTNLTTNDKNGFLATTDTGELHQITISVDPEAYASNNIKAKDCIVSYKPCNFKSNWLENDAIVDLKRYGIKVNDECTDGNFIYADFTILPRLTNTNLNIDMIKSEYISSKYSPLINTSILNVQDGICFGYTDKFILPLNGKCTYLEFTTGEDVQSQQFIASQDKDMPLINSIFIQNGYFVDLHSISFDSNFNVVYNFTPILPASPNTTYVLKVPNEQFVKEHVQICVKGLNVWAETSWNANSEITVFCAGSDIQYQEYTFKGTLNFKESYAQDGTKGIYKFYSDGFDKYTGYYYTTGNRTAFCNFYTPEKRCKTKLGFGALDEIYLCNSETDSKNLVIEITEPVFRWYFEGEEVPISKYGLTINGEPKDGDIITLDYYHLPYAYIGNYEIKSSTSYKLLFQNTGANSYSLKISDSLGNVEDTGLNVSINNTADMFKNFKGSVQLTYSIVNNQPLSIINDTWMYNDTIIDPSLYGVQIIGEPSYDDTLLLTFTTGSEVNLGVKTVKEDEDYVIAVDYLNNTYYPTNVDDSGERTKINVSKDKHYTLLVSNDNGSLKFWFAPRVRLTGEYKKDTSLLYNTLNSTNPNLQIDANFGLERVNDIVINGKLSLGKINGISNNTYHLIFFGKTEKDTPTTSFYSYYPTCYGEKNLLFNCIDNKDHLSITTNSKLSTNLTTKQSIYNYKATHSCSRYMYLDNKESYVEYILDNYYKDNRVDSFSLEFDFTTVDEIKQCTILSDFVSSNSYVDLSANGKLSIGFDTSKIDESGEVQTISFDTDSNFILPHTYYKVKIDFNAYDFVITINGKEVANLDVSKYGNTISEEPYIVESSVYGLPTILYLGVGRSGYYHGILKNILLDINADSYNRDVYIPLENRLKDEYDKYEYVNHGARFVSVPQLINDTTNSDLYGNPLIGIR